MPRSNALENIHPGREITIGVGMGPKVGRPELPIPLLPENLANVLKRVKTQLGSQLGNSSKSLSQLIEPGDIAALIADRNGTTALTLTMAGFDEARKSAVITAGVRDYTDQFTNRKITKPQLQTAMRRLETLDDTTTGKDNFLDQRRPKANENMKVALGRLPENKFAQVTKALPTAMMERLGRLDCDICGPKRMAGYISNAIGAAFVTERKMSGSSEIGATPILPDRGRWARRTQTLEATLSLQLGLVGQLLDIVSERDKEKPGDDFAYTVIELLAQKEDSFVTAALARLATDPDFDWLTDHPKIRTLMSS